MKNTGRRAARHDIHSPHPYMCTELPMSPHAPLTLLDGGPRTERRKVEMSPLEDKGGSDSNSQVHQNQRERERKEESFGHKRTVK